MEKYLTVGLTEKVYVRFTKEGQNVVLLEIEKMTGKTGSDCLTAMQTLYSSDVPDFYAMTLTEIFYLFRRHANLGAKPVFNQIVFKNKEDELFDFNPNYPIYYHITNKGMPLVIDAARNSENYSPDIYLYFCEALHSYNEDYYLQIGFYDVMSKIGLLFKTTNEEVFENNEVLIKRENLHPLKSVNGF